MSTRNNPKRSMIEQETDDETISTTQLSKRQRKNKSFEESTSSNGVVTIPQSEEVLPCIPEPQDLAVNRYLKHSDESLNNKKLELVAESGTEITPLDTMKSAKEKRTKPKKEAYNKRRFGISIGESISRPYIYDTLPYIYTDELLRAVRQLNIKERYYGGEVNRNIKYFFHGVGDATLHFYLYKYVHDKFPELRGNHLRVVRSLIISFGVPDGKEVLTKRILPPHYYNPELGPDTSVSKPEFYEYVGTLGIIDPTAMFSTLDQLTEDILSYIKEPLDIQRSETSKYIGTGFNELVSSYFTVNYNLLYMKRKRFVEIDEVKFELPQLPKLENEVHLKTCLLKPLVQIAGSTEDRFIGHIRHNASRMEGLGDGLLKFVSQKVMFENFRHTSTRFIDITLNFLNSNLFLKRLVSAYHLDRGLKPDARILRRKKCFQKEKSKVPAGDLFETYLGGIYLQDPDTAFNWIEQILVGYVGTKYHMSMIQERYRNKAIYEALVARLVVRNGVYYE